MNRAATAQRAIPYAAPPPRQQVEILRAHLSILRQLNASSKVIELTEQALEEAEARLAREEPQTAR